MELRNRSEVMNKAAPGCRAGDPSHPERRAVTLGAASLRRAAKLFRAMGDEPRLRLLELLAEDEWCVTELVESLQEKFSTVSQRLRILGEAGLVVRRRQGTHIYYALADRHVANMIRNALAHADELEAGPSRQEE